MNTVTKQRKPVDTGFVFSIGPVVHLAELDNVMREFARQPWEAGDSQMAGGWNTHCTGRCMGRKYK